MPYRDPAVQGTFPPFANIVETVTVTAVPSITDTADPSSHAKSTPHPVWTVSNCRHQADPHGGNPDSCHCDGYSSALPTLTGSSPCAYSTFSSVAGPATAKVTQSQVPGKAALSSSKNGTISTHVMTTTKTSAVSSINTQAPNVNAGPKMEKVAISMAIVCSLQVMWLLWDSL